MAKYLILGDVHLGKGLSLGKPGSGGILNGRIQDQLDLLNWTLEQAKQNQVANIFLTGDIYEEPRPHPAIIRLFMLWLKQCEKQSINVHIIAGNHDIIRSGAYSSSALDLVPAVELSHSTVYKATTAINFDDVSFLLVPYTDRRILNVDTPAEALSIVKSSIEDQYRNLTNPLKICIGHLAIEGSIFVGDEIDDLLNEVFCPVSLFADFDYTWMGHVHNPQVLSKSPYVAHVGSMDRSDFHKNETNFDKVLILIDSDTKSFKEIVIPTRKLCKVCITVPENKDSTDFVINELYSDNTLTGSIVRLEITLTGSDLPNVDRDKISKFLIDNMFIHHLVSISESRVLQPITSKSSVFDNNVTTQMAIAAFADTIVVDDEEEKKMFKEFATSCYEELKS